MIHFIGTDAVEDCIANKVDSLAIPVAVDTIGTAEPYLSLCTKYPELKQKYEAFANGREMRVGYSISINLDNGLVVFLLFIKIVDKYQANIVDIQKAIHTTLERMGKFGKKSILLHNITTENTKLSDQLLLPSIVYELSLFKDIDTYFINSTNTSIIQTIDEANGITVFRNSWQSSWLLTEDDILVMAIIADLQGISNGVKLSKSRMLNLYKVCHDNGIYPKSEFTKGEYGWYFKEFMIKLNALLNHGLLIDTERFSTSKRTDYHIGPTFPILLTIAANLFYAKREYIREVAIAIRTRFIEIRKEAYEKRKNDPNNNPGYGG